MRQILLVEPGYRNKYPPLGLMKLARYHKELGDNVVFVKGKSPQLRAYHWDRVYVSTLFTFFWRETVATIAYYRQSTDSPRDVIVGGVLATILKGKLEEHFPEITVHAGLLDKKGTLDKGTYAIIDRLVPDYTILEQIDYQYPASDAYFAYYTRGCVNRCKFCAVPLIEPTFKHYIDIKESISQVEEEVGPRKDLLLLDNNILASRFFPKIIREIKDLGFYKGAKLNLKLRHLDFNQGVDLRLIDERKIELLSTTCIRPLRIAFDHIKYKEQYIKAIELAAKHDILNLSNYVLYNYTDTPKEFYDRLRINVELNDRLGTKIYSFPMKYIPVTETDRRNFVGKHWTWKMIRGVQCILNATHGVVSTRLEFFKKAFGKDAEEFFKIINMPEKYILYRLKHEDNGASEWHKSFDLLSKKERQQFISLIAKDRYDQIEPTGNSNIDQLIPHYAAGRR